MSFRNRCTLIGSNGNIDLSIPLIGGRDQRALIKEVRIQNSVKWQSHHWKTITACYNKSPWFDHFRDELEQLYLRKFEWLFDWDMECFTWAADKMSIKIQVAFTESYHHTYNQSAYEDWRNHLTPSTIHEIDLPEVKYPQVFEDRLGFIPKLSVLDYLFCVGGMK